MIHPSESPIDERRYLIPFRSLLLPHIVTDTLVIGTGVAGLRAAIEASGHGDVIVLAKDAANFSNTAWAQGGIAAVLADDDSNLLHVEDTLQAGAGLCIDETVRTVVGEGPAEIDRLLGWGMRLDRDEGGALHLGREGGHHRNRIVHADGDATGRELVRTLLERARAIAQERGGLRIFERCFALDLITAGVRGNGNGNGGNAPVLGAITHHPRYGLQIIWAKATILASGGVGQVYRETTNPKVATGDGLAMAWRAGASLADLEFMQFHPTTLYVAGASRALLSEAIRGEGGYLVDRRGNRFMVGQHELAELAPRDIVSRGIMAHLARTQDSNVFLDVRHLGSARFEARFPGLAAMLRSYEIDPGRDLIPVQPAAHYTIGGVWVDLFGRTDVPGLYAVGEVACNGLHGANRLASNSLLEGLVFGARVGKVAAERADANRGPTQIVSDIRPSDRSELDLVDVRSSLRSAMWRNVGIERAGSRLADAADMLAFWSRYSLDKIFDDLGGWEVQNLLTVASLMTRAAAWREESRGTHCRVDFPNAEPRFAVHARWVKGSAEPVCVAATSGAALPAASTRG
jgi:L-aspartate oxidase